MLPDIQLGRRNLSSIQRIAIVEKYRPIYEKQAKERQSNAGKDYGNGKKKLPPKMGEAKKTKDNETNAKLSKLAGVSKETYRMGAKIFHCDNEELKEEVLSGEKSINAGYTELTEKKFKV